MTQTRFTVTLVQAEESLYERETTEHLHFRFRSSKDGGNAISPRSWSSLPTGIVPSLGKPALGIFCLNPPDSGCMPLVRRSKSRPTEMSPASNVRLMPEADSAGATHQVPPEGYPLVVTPLSASERRGKGGYEVGSLFFYFNMPTQPFNSAQFEVVFNDTGKEPKCLPQLLYPEGVDLDISEGADPACRVELPYPAPRCGHWMIDCRKCGMSVAVSAAGRFDDPRSLRMRCKTKT